MYLYSNIKNSRIYCTYVNENGTTDLKIWTVVEVKGIHGRIYTLNLRVDLNFLLLPCS